MVLRTYTAMAENVAANDCVYPSNSNVSDFKESFQTMPDDNSEIFDPAPSFIRFRI